MFNLENVKVHSIKEIQNVCLFFVRLLQLKLVWYCSWFVCLFVCFFQIETRFSKFITVTVKSLQNVKHVHELWDLKKILLVRLWQEGEEGAILVDQVYFGLGWEMVRTIFLQFFIWLTDGEGGCGDREGEREKEDQGGKKRNRGHWSSSTMHHVQQQRVGYRVGWRQPQVHWCSTLTGKYNLQSPLGEHPQRVPSAPQMSLYSATL